MIKTQPFLVARLRKRIPVEARCFECGSRAGIGYSRACGDVAERDKMSKFISSACGCCRSQLLLEITKEQKRTLCSEFLSHKEQWRRGSQEEYGHSDTDSSRTGNLDNPFSKSTVPDLVVILKKRYKSREGKTFTRFTPL